MIQLFFLKRWVTQTDKKLNHQSFLKKYQNIVYNNSDKIFKILSKQLKKKARFRLKIKKKTEIMPFTRKTKRPNEIICYKIQNKWLHCSNNCEIYFAIGTKRHEIIKCIFAYRSNNILTREKYHTNADAVCVCMCVLWYGTPPYGMHISKDNNGGIDNSHYAFDSK